MSKKRKLLTICACIAGLLFAARFLWTGARGLQSLTPLAHAAEAPLLGNAAAAAGSTTRSALSSPNCPPQSMGSAAGAEACVRPAYQAAPQAAAPIAAALTGRQPSRSQETTGSENRVEEPAVGLSDAGSVSAPPAGQAAGETSVEPVQGTMGGELAAPVVHAAITAAGRVWPDPDGSATVAPLRPNQRSAAVEKPGQVAAPAPATAPRPTAAPSPVAIAERPQPTPVAVPSAIPTSAGAPAAKADSINGVPISQIVVMPPAAQERARQVFAKGQAAGRNAQAFSKIGDSTMVWPPLVEDFDTRKNYNLGPYVYLQPTIDFLAGSFRRASAAVKKGMHTWSEFDPAWVAIGGCQPGEGPLACELRLNNPSIVIMRLGANDAFMPTEYEQNLRKILDFCLERGVIPIVGTKPDRREGPQNTINGIVHRLAAEYNVPLWDYDLVAGTVPGKGLEPDLIHFTAGDTHDYSSPRAFCQGDPLEDLSALMALDAVRQAVVPH